MISHSRDRAQVQASAQSRALVTYSLRLPEQPPDMSDWTCKHCQNSNYWQRTRCACSCVCVHTHTLTHTLEYQRGACLRIVRATARSSSALGRRTPLFDWVVTRCPGQATCAAAACRVSKRAGHRRHQHRHTGMTWPATGLRRRLPSHMHRGGPTATPTSLSRHPALISGLGRDRQSAPSR